MRIAFVGKGGSGKTTLSALFSQLVKDKMECVVSIDADINVNLPELLIGERFPTDKFLSSSDSSKRIKRWLLGKNDIGNLEMFRKTTPPNSGSNLVQISKLNETIFKDFVVEKEGINLMAVGTYGGDGIGVSCYHNNLAILENLLTHLVDDGGVVVDMVAGTDAFASSMYVQFDLIVLVVEPTRKGVEMFKQYSELGDSAGVGESIFVVGNKVSSDSDRKFLVDNIPEDKLVGFVSNSDYIRDYDKVGGVIDLEKISSSDREILTNVFNLLTDNVKNPNDRLKKIHTLHKRYVSQPFIKDRFGDLTNQIEPDFRI